MRLVSGVRKCWTFFPQICARAACTTGVSEHPSSARAGLAPPRGEKLPQRFGGWILGVSVPLAGAVPCTAPSQFARVADFHKKQGICSWKHLQNQPSLSLVHALSTCLIQGPGSRLQASPRAALLNALVFAGPQRKMMRAWFPPHDGRAIRGVRGGGLSA